MTLLKKFTTKLSPYLQTLGRWLVYLGILITILLPIMLSFGQFQLAENLGNYLFYLLLAIFSFQFLDHFFLHKN
jgi:hypothetical protein